MTAIVAQVVTRDCIGCTLCLDACPFDAIAGLSGHAHFVLPDLCPGCKLCIPACPVDCIALIPDPEHPLRDDAYRQAARDRARAHRTRIATQHADEQRTLDAAHARLRDQSEAERQRAIDALLDPESPS